MRTKQEILDDYSGYTEEEKDKKIIIELLFDIRDLLKPVEPSKPSEEGGYVLVDSDRDKIFPTVKLESEIRADEREKIAKTIEEFAHKEMKDGNWAYEKLLILLKTFYI